MSIDPLNSIPDVVTRGPGITGPHNTSWPIRHGHPHGGEGPRGFPPPGGGPPVGAGDIGRGMPGFGGNDRGGAGVDRPNGGGMGIDRPGPGGSGGPGPGQGMSLGNTVNAALGLPAQVLNPAGHPHGHVPGQAVSQHAQMATPAPGWVQPQAAQGAMLQQPALVPQAAAAQPAPIAQHAQAAQPVQAAQPAHVALAAQPARADAHQAPPRGDAAPVFRGEAGAERMAMLQRAPATPMAPVNAPAAGTQASATAAAAAAAAAGATLATAPASAAPATVAQVQTAEVRSANPLTAGDRGQNVVRPEGGGAYTGEGPQRRSLRGSIRTLPGGLATLLTALGAPAHTGAGGRDPRAAERELRESMMQWLFWLLAIIAYGCVAFAVIGLMPAGGLGGLDSGGGGVGSRAWAGGFAVAGLVAGAGAWWFARGIARGGRDGS